ncbi:MAG: hypothetical protein ACXW3C_06440 [Pyrinomonadaceae bacterium]
MAVEIVNSFSGTRDILLRVRDSSTLRFRLIGLLPLTLFLAQTVHYWRYGGLSHLAWMCNVGNLLMAFGIFLNHKESIRAAAIWTVPGLGIWFWYVWLSGSTALSSTLAHVGGIMVAVYVLRRVRMDRVAWVYALVWYLLMQILSRVVTAPVHNVNVAFRIQDGWENAFGGSFWKFWIVMTVVVAVVLWVIGIVFTWIWPQQPVANADLPEVA